MLHGAPLCPLVTVKAHCQLAPALWEPTTQAASFHTATALPTSRHAHAQMVSTPVTGSASTHLAAHATSASRACVASLQAFRTSRTLQRWLNYGQLTEMRLSAQAPVASLSGLRSWPVLKATLANVLAGFARCCRPAPMCQLTANWSLHKAAPQLPWTCALWAAPQPVPRCQASTHLLASNQQQAAVQTAMTAPSHRAKCATSRSPQMSGPAVQAWRAL